MPLKILKRHQTMSAVAQKSKPDKTNRLSFGQRLAQIRKAKGLTQEELGQRIGVSQRIMHHYENKADYPPAQKIIELAQALDMSVDELLAANGNNQGSYQNINPKLAKRLRLASNLPPSDLKALATYIDALILKQKVKNEA
jgi:transcriptional regulator with XRE-family HTH domain